MNLITENMYLPTISYLDIIRTNNLVNICWGKVVFYRCSVIVLLPNFSLNFSKFNEKLNKTERTETLTQSVLKNVAIVREMNARISRTAAWHTHAYSYHRTLCFSQVLLKNYNF